MEENEKSIGTIKLIDLMEEVSKEPKPKMLWKGIPEGSYGLITGVAKTGKTTFAENLAISLAVGRKEFFETKMDGTPRKVLFINLEESYRIRCRRNLKQVSVLSESELKLFSENFESTPKDFLEFLNSEEDWEKLNELIMSSEAEVVFIDSLTHMFNGKIEDSSAGRKFIELYTRYLLNVGKTLIIIHHNTKGNDKPIDQDSVAGSRVILQWFQFSFGMANIPTEKGGNYLCMLNNKFVEKDDTTAFLYKNNENGWIEFIGRRNKFSLYKSFSNLKVDGRYDDTNEKCIYNYFQNQYSQGIQTISTSTIANDLVFSDKPTMSTDTFHKAKNRLIEKEKIKKVRHGVYSLVNLEGIENERKQ